MTNRIIIVATAARSLFWDSLPLLWRPRVVVMHPAQFAENVNGGSRDGGCDDTVCTVGDAGYAAVSRVLDNPANGFCQTLAELCINKYTTRQSLKTMQDIPHRHLVNNDKHSMMLYFFFREC